MTFSRVREPKEFLGENSLVNFAGEPVWFCESQDSYVALFVAPEGSQLAIEKYENLTFRIESYSVNELKPREYLTLGLKKLEQSELLFGFIRLLTPKIESSNSLSDLVSVIVAEYKTWSDFFGSGQLSAELANKLIGVYGELHFLQFLLENSIHNALESWWGPFRNRHDFEFSKIIYEIKSSINPAKNEITVHGLDQLVDPYERSVFLVLSKFYPSDHGSNLTDMISSILKLGASESEIMSKIEKAGFPVEMIESTSHIYFEHLESFIYPVDADFPIIKRNSMNGSTAERVVKLDYVLNLSGLPYKKLSSFELPDHD